VPDETVTVGFAGLSHLGLVYGLATAAKGMEVRAFDPDKKLVKALRRGELPVNEPGLENLWKETRARMSWHADPRALSECGLVFISLDVVTDGRDRSDTRPLEKLICNTLPRLRPGTVVVLLSQVDPGFARQKLLPTGESVGLKVFYQVETLVFGRAVERALQPERFIVGSSAPSDPLPEPLRRWHAAFGCPVLVMGLESAELCKIAINFFLVSSVCTTNTLAEVAALAGADWSEIAPALRLDARIGPKAYLSPGLGVGGGNLPRDLQALRHLAGGGQADLCLVDGWLRCSAHHRDWATRSYGRLLRGAGISARHAKVGVWGLAYKEDTASVKNSPSLRFLERTKAAEKRVFDPVARLPKKIPGIRQVGDMTEACRGADVLAILTPWSEFRKADPASALQAMRKRLVLDPYGLISPARWKELGATCLTLGKN
jgi:UDPglucose 6-dehydrogenase